MLGFRRRSGAATAGRPRQPPAVTSRWDCTVESTADDSRFANRLVGFQATGGSTSVRAFFVPLREAGATARAMLITAAADRWQVDPAACRTESGVVVHGASGRRLSYGDLVDQAASLPVPDQVALKAPEAFKLIGTPAKRLDSAAKVSGRAVFSIDVKVPGMRIATVAACPVFGGKLAAVDDKKALAVRGVRQIVRELIKDAARRTPDQPHGHLGSDGWREFSRIIEACGRALITYAAAPRTLIDERSYGSLLSWCSS